jgi:hypothetical protein
MGMLGESGAGAPSYVTENLAKAQPVLTDAEVPSDTRPDVCATGRTRLLIVSTFIRERHSNSDRRYVLPRLNQRFIPLSVEMLGPNVRAMERAERQA